MWQINSFQPSDDNLVNSVITEFIKDFVVTNLGLHTKK